MPAFPIRRSRTILIAAAALISVSPLRLAADGPTPYPASPSEWPGSGPVRVFAWMKDNREHFWKQRDKSQGAIVFVGDSLIGNWKGLTQALPDRQVANRGIGGDVTRGVLFRFQEDVLDLQPKAIVLLIGTNDLSAKAKVDDIVSNISATLDLARKQDPAPPVILCTIPPRDSDKAPIDRASLEALNERINQLASEREGVTLLDTYALFAQPDGSPDPQYFKEDKLHLSPGGYEKFAEAVTKVLPASS